MTGESRSSLTMPGWLPLWAAVVVVMTSVHVTSGSGNLLRNPSFEDDLEKKDWDGGASVLEIVTSDAVDGAKSLSCTDRENENAGPLQGNIPMIKGRHYYFEGYLKLLNNNIGKIWQNVKVLIQMTLEEESPENKACEKKADCKNETLTCFQKLCKNRQSYIIAYRGFLTAEKGWVRINGSIEAPQKDPSEVRLVIRGPDVDIGFLTDNLTLVEVPENPMWRQEADKNIYNLRKANIKLNVELPRRGVRSKSVDVEVKLKKHAFGFGAKIEEFELCNPVQTQYEKIYNNWFNWAAIQAYKWKFGGGNSQLTLNFSRATNANECLLKNGKTVRGHSILWDLEKNVPDWVKALDDAHLRPVMDHHINFMMNLTKDKIIQFDVQNEHIHGHYYEERLQDPDVTKNAFRLAKAANPNGPVLYLNDFTAVTSGASTEDLYDLGMEYKREGVPIGGLGIQGHTKDFVKPDPTAMWRRLDRLGETGLDLMMTEFDIGWPDYEVRADWLEDSIRAFFGHPKLKGMIMWGFHNDSMRDPFHELVNGPTTNDLTIMETGKRWACLVKKEFMTREKFNMASSRSRRRSFNIRGFKGDYDVIVRVKGDVVAVQTFTLGDKDATVDVQVPGRGAEPMVYEEEEDLVPQCLSFRDERTVAQRSTTSDDAQLTCRTEQSRASGANEFDNVGVSCNDDEVMTSCTSNKLNKKWTHKGQKMETTFVDGQERVTCTAYNGKDGSRVVAYARCCKVAGLTCAYRAAGPSLVFDGAMAEARCPAGSQALGCSVYHPYSEMQGVLTSPGFSGCRAVNGVPSNSPFERSGTYASSACCRATNPLECQTIESKPARGRQGRRAQVKCNSGFVMTGCAAHALNGKPAGAYISGRNTPKCRAIQGVTLADVQTMEGVKAYATCCRVQ